MSSHLSDDLSKDARPPSAPPEGAAPHCGIGTIHDIADYYRLNIPFARPIVAELVASGEVEEVTVPGWRGPVYLDPEAKRPRSIGATTLLSPFDPVVWYRERAERLFGFHYRIEIYVPEDKRVHGYYVLPFMLEGELVGRVDVKADRKASTLLVRSAFVEEGRTTIGLRLHLPWSWNGSQAGWTSIDISVANKGNLSAVSSGSAARLRERALCSGTGAVRTSADVDADDRVASRRRDLAGCAPVPVHEHHSFGPTQEQEVGAVVGEAERLVLLLDRHDPRRCEVSACHRQRVILLGPTSGTASR